MEAVISRLLKRFEDGVLTRRELIRGLALLTAAGVTESAAAPQSTALRSMTIDHISIQVTDLQRSISFYEQVFGLAVVNEDTENEISRMGRAGKIIVSLHHKNPTGIVDHFAIGVENFDREAVAETLMEMGITPQQNLDAGFHIKDPEGINVQIVGA